MYYRSTSVEVVRERERESVVGVMAPSKEKAIARNTPARRRDVVVVVVEVSIG